ncbi:hypothetical protein BOTBODRAFT_29559 [Botryobasidium botryosum FD-172 SS1]|uniref:Bis(5'-adenosyl)-triphosphatase n=1 Tax=Botryobasidium botryosum (strain FD-172 SS1) TaxID=930990 RepID=A0A067MRJ2_BOTB1|nr:hypothetical protein BOTBODRAFT_29559 [Botryobasidium botryosum FD-172 SS1]
MASAVMRQAFFSTFDVTRQVFFRSATSFGLVNLKPILPGHVLIVPNRVVPRMSDLTNEEVADIFQSARDVGKVLEKVYDAEAITMACQDGPAAGQTVPHVHVHVIPRRFTDFGGDNDKVYPELEKSEVVLEAELIDTYAKKAEAPFLKVDNDSRKPRSLEEMEKEAKWLSEFFADSGP